LQTALLSGTVNDHGSAAVSGSAVTITASDFYFRATCLRVASGGSITVTVTNGGTALHNFSVTSLGIDKDVQAGQSITIKVRLPASGAVPFFCKYHVASGMQGAFVIG
jgi:plastocyanin